jgi:hypothetical protein
MSKRIVRSLAMFALLLGLVAGPLADVSSAQRPRRYPPTGGPCQIHITQNRNFIHIRIVCRGIGIVLNLRIILRSEPVYLGTFTTDATGSLDTTVPVPESLQPGAHHLQIFKAEDVSVPSGAPKVVTSPNAVVPATTIGNPLESIPLQVVDHDGTKSVLAGSTTGTSGESAAAATDAGGSSSKTPLTAAAIGLVGIGAGGMVIARRRRKAADAPSAV